MFLQKGLQETNSLSRSLLFLKEPDVTDILVLKGKETLGCGKAIKGQYLTVSLVCSLAMIRHC